MKIMIPLALGVDLEAWAAEYGLQTPHGAPDVEYAARDAREQIDQAASTQEIAKAIVQAWPVLRDLATVTAGTPYRADDIDAAVGALIDAFGLDPVAQVVRHRANLAADDTIARVVQVAVAASDFGPDSVPVAVVFDTMNYDNGDFLYDGSATVFFANGEDDMIEFGDRDANTLNMALNLDGACAPGARVLVNIGTGHVERYEPNEPNEHDVMASELAAWVKRANALGV